MRPAALVPATAIAVTALGLAGTVTASTATVPATSHPPAAATDATRSMRLPAPRPLLADSPVTPAWTAGPPTTHYCRTQLGVACYSPLQLRRAYRVGSLLKAGVTGKGAVIGIVDSFGSPTIRHDLHVFDKAYGLPDPKLQIVHPAGAPPKFNGANGTMRGWAGETTLDVEYAHAIAPGAKLLLVETPSAETEGVHGFPDMMRSERWLVRHTRVGVISQSFGATEPTFPSKKSLENLRYAFQAAKRNHVTVLGASGDDGSTDYRSDGSRLYDHRVNSWPSSDPLVTSVGGTQVHLDAKGNRTKADSVWNDGDTGHGASGGGLSQMFDRPGFQNSVQSVVGSHRGTPDISLNAAVSSRVVVYSTFPGQPQGWGFAAGTSEATPLLAGVVALAIQKAGHPLGDINPALYSMKGAASTGIVDVVGGDNGYNGVPGWPVVAGYDLGTGWGTIDVSLFVPALVKAVRQVSSS